MYADTLAKLAPVPSYERLKSDYQRFSLEQQNIDRSYSIGPSYWNTCVDASMDTCMDGNINASMDTYMDGNNNASMDTDITYNAKLINDTNTSTVNTSSNSHNTTISADLLFDDHADCKDYIYNDIANYDLEEDKRPAYDFSLNNEYNKEYNYNSNVVTFLEDNAEDNAEDYLTGPNDLSDPDEEYDADSAYPDDDDIRSDYCPGDEYNDTNLPTPNDSIDELTTDNIIASSSSTSYDEIPLLLDTHPVIHSSNLFK